MASEVSECGVPKSALYPGPSRERIAQIQRDFYYDNQCDAWKGKKLGPYYGAIFHVTARGLVLCRFRDGRMLALRLPQPALPAFPP